MSTQPAMTDAFDGGFADPVFGSQAAFRAIMDAMARPGSRHRIDHLDVEPPAPLQAAAGTIALTLCDADTPVWLNSSMSEKDIVAHWLGFHTGAPVTADPRQAAFALIGDGASIAAFDKFALGTQDYPDQSATLIIQVPDLAGGPPLTLTGPGIKHEAQCAPQGLPARFTELWAANGALFPRGVDLIMAAPTEIAALPRTTRVHEARA